MTSVESFLDATYLKRDAEFVIPGLLDSAVRLKVASVCVPGLFAYDTIEQRNKLADSHGFMVPVCSVANFPMGYAPLDTVLREVQLLFRLGVDEVDVVIPPLLHDERLVKEFLRELRLVSSKIIKIIIESDSLVADDVYKTSAWIAEAGLDYVKTSTGFNSQARIQDVQIMLDAVKDSSTLVKASGGIKTRNQALAFINMGVSRIGSSSFLQD